MILIDMYLFMEKKDNKAMIYINNLILAYTDYQNKNLDLILHLVNSKKGSVLWLSIWCNMDNLLIKK